jgi:hypothetical protein
MRYLSRRLGPSRRTRGILPAVASVGVLIAAAAPEPYTGPCSWDEVLAEFDVADRAELAVRVPGLADSPEVSGEPILVNGEPAGLSIGPLHVVVVKCVRSDQVGTYGQLGASRPSVIHNVVAIRTAEPDSWIFSDVSLDGLNPGATR